MYLLTICVWTSGLALVCLGAIWFVFIAWRSRRRKQPEIWWVIVFLACIVSAFVLFELASYCGRVCISHWASESIRDGAELSVNGRSRPSAQIDNAFLTVESRLWNHNSIRDVYHIEWSSHSPARRVGLLRDGARRNMYWVEFIFGRSAWQRFKVGVIHLEFPPGYIRGSG